VFDRPLGTIRESEWDRRLWRMVFASAVLHVVALAVLMLVPHVWVPRPPPLQSYTVDLVAPDKLGGNNLLQGGKGRAAGPVMAAAAVPPKVEPPKPPEPKPEPPKPEVVVKPPEAKPPEPPKVEEQPKPNEVALAEKPTQVAPTPTRPPSAPTARPTPAPSPPLVAKVEPPPKPQPPTPPKLTAKEIEARKAAEAKAAAQEKAAKEAAQRDQRIAAAIKRVEQQGVRGGGSGTKAEGQPGGPISAGPGEGVGGAVRGVEYLLYYNQMINRIKQSWAWASRNDALEATVHFGITETGEVVDVRITHSSGDASYDASVERAVRTVNPLAAPPLAYRKEFSDVELTFRPSDLQM